MNKVKKLKPLDALNMYPFHKDGTVKTIEWFKAHLRKGDMKKIRQSIGMTQSDFSEYYGTTQSNISRLENKIHTIANNEFMHYVYAIHNIYWILSTENYSNTLNETVIKVYGDKNG